MSLTVREDCLNDIIGLSRSECACTNVPTNTSLSGKYLDEVEGLQLQMMNEAADCDAGGLWDLMRKARERAILDTKTHLSSRIIELHKVSRKPFNGVIGEQKHTSTLPISGYAGQRYVMLNIPAGLWRINQVGLAFNATETFTLYIYNNLQSTALYTISGLVSEAGKVVFRTLAEPIELPMSNTRVPYLEYYFIYVNNGALPLDNKISCGCGGFYPGFSCTNPPFANIGTVSDARNRWNEFCVVTGKTSNSISDFTDANMTYNDRCYGILLDCEMKCNIRDLVCADLDFEASEVAMAVADAVFYRGGEVLAEFIVSSGEPGRYTLLAKEHLWGKRNHYRKEHFDRIEWLANNMDLSRSGCITCNQRIHKGGIRS